MLGMVVCCPHCNRNHEINVGSLIGGRRSKAKSKAARENGKKGGRPRKTPKVEPLRKHKPNNGTARPGNEA